MMQEKLDLGKKTMLKRKDPSAMSAAHQESIAAVYTFLGRNGFAMGYKSDNGSDSCTAVCIGGAARYG